METDSLQYTVSISKEELAALPMVSYVGEITVIDNPENVDAAIAELRKSRIIGFDTETKPSFKRGQHHTVALLQLSTDTQCFLFRLNKIGFPESIADFLEDPSILKIGLSLHDDFCNLRRLKEINPDGFIDLQKYVKSFSIEDNSLAKIYAIIFGERISKAQRLSNWEAPELTAAQQAYAALDALACIRIYRKLRSGGFRAENSIYKKFPATDEK